jgi:hypothetical protein
MRMLIAVATLTATPLVATAPAAATAGHQAAVSRVAAVVTAGRARDGLAQPPAAPPVPQVRDAATPRRSDDAKSGGETAVLPRHHPESIGTAPARAATPEAPQDRASAGSAGARAPPAAT